MKLYLLKQIKELALERWDTLEAIEEEKSRRQIERLKRTKKSVKKTMADSMQVRYIEMNSI